MRKKKLFRLFVATHKPGIMRKDNIYIPIHVGRAISPYKKELCDIIGDDTGDNISSKNPSYCEMTAHYWIWKNVVDCEYVGLCLIILMGMVILNWSVSVYSVSFGSNITFALGKSYKK